MVLKEFRLKFRGADINISISFIKEYHPALADAFLFASMMVLQLVESNMEGKNTDMNSFYTDLTLTNPSRCFHQTDCSIPYLLLTQSYNKACRIHISRECKEFGYVYMPLIWYSWNGNPEDWKICLNENTIWPASRWFHQVWIIQNIIRTSYATLVRCTRSTVKSMASCSKRISSSIPWTEVIVDLNDLWSLLGLMK